MSDKYTIMFICSGNTCRSPMAAGALKVLLEKKRPGKFEAISAGTGAATDFPATEFAVEASRIWNCDLSEHRSQPLTEALIEESDLILAMTPSHLRELIRLNPGAQHKYFLLKNFPDPNPEGEGVDDPIGMPLDYYKDTFLEIGEEIGRFLPEIVKRIDEAVGAHTK
ncbi:MAG TPA: low molecular weight protein arginine phosphatase [candidate division Zixibacteria bacterium]|nr:low molecular weight protein arginine phosphatase [candidate division Zixibacteria bacterium]